MRAPVDDTDTSQDDGEEPERVTPAEKRAALAQLAAIRAQTDRKIILVIHIQLGYHILRFFLPEGDAAAAAKVVWVHSFSVGLDAYRLAEIEDRVRDILITNGRHSQSMALAEYVFYSIFYFNRLTWRQQQQQAARAWEPYDIEPLTGKRMVIFGYGDIGRAAAKMAAAFGVTVVGVRRRLPPPEEQQPDVAVVLITDAAAVAAALQSADFVVNTLPHTTDTDGYFHRDRFAQMKRTALYVNVGRGATQVDDDIAAVLQQGVIRGASLDVFGQEPLPTTSALYDVPPERLLMNPHAAARSADQIYALCGRITAIAEAAAAGKDLSSFSVNRVQWY
ncbi:D-isomer specific 2-hydroxyacid dehydrogenase-protein [Strigomonas culicis]|uniref:D-isomer specific 2-hydroxyacid dehydrogenase-protein n=1 Tax=Strigomonas culicis TaxID=28005 RepID=S9VK97_9TRYP|nr:D-isomer specific 2-hydroxyacid dehydrogenase-protein [Strigomonas culicis]|eukprot:EPY27521.1 D-isomer specific 2-hydroxyacid dehydrogenase-protein [Strigomonas culicis]